MSSKIAKQMMSRVDEMVTRASSATKQVRGRLIYSCLCVLQRQHHSVQVCGGKGWSGVRRGRSKRKHNS